jgi:FixJ family two-component response regulator
MNTQSTTAVDPSVLALESTVFIVDDDADTRGAISRLVRSSGLAEQEFASARQFLDQYDEAKPGCLVLDIKMPVMSGLELQQSLHIKDVQLPIIFITGHGEVSVVTQAIRDGAVDVIPKPFRAELLLSRIQEAIALDLANRRKRVQVVEIQQRIKSLTDREYEVMQHLAAGDSAKQIAQKLSISPKTVDNHRAKALEKMQVDNPTQLAHQLALLNGDLSALSASNSARPGARL